VADLANLDDVEIKELDETMEDYDCA